MLLWATLWAALLLGLLWINLPPSSTSVQAAIEAAIVKSENAIRPTLPKKIDEITTLVAIHHAASKVQYEVVVDLSKIAPKPTASFVQQLRTLGLQTVCNSEMVHSFRFGASYEYLYRDENLTTWAATLFQTLIVQIQPNKLSTFTRDSRAKKTKRTTKAK